MLVHFEPIVDTKALFETPKNFVLKKPIEAVVYSIACSILSVFLPALLAWPLTTAFSMIWISALINSGKFYSNFKEQISNNNNIFVYVKNLAKSVFDTLTM